MSVAVPLMRANGAGTFRIANGFEMARLGFGASRIVGRGVWGPPSDHSRAIAVLKRVRELGINFIDTADAYGPAISEELIAEALHPYGDQIVATKGGFTRHGPDIWRAVGRSDYLRQCCLMSLRRLRVDVIDLWQLHRIDPREPRDEQFGVMKELQDEGKVRHLGLSEVTVDDIKAAQDVFTVAAVQNRYNIVDRSSQDVLTYCEQQGIAFICWHPLDAGRLAGPGGPIHDAAQRHGATTSQVALAWLLAKSPALLAIPGTGSVEHLDENASATNLRLTDEDVAAIEHVLAGDGSSSSR